MRLIPTDQVFELNEEQRQEARKHEEHNPEDHICEDCLGVWEDWCWAKKNGLEKPSERELAIVPEHHRDDNECKCECHFAFWACTQAQTVLKNDGMPLYQVEDEEREQSGGIKVVIPYSVVEQFEAMSEEDCEDAIAFMLNQVEEKQLKHGVMKGTMKRR